MAVLLGRFVVPQGQASGILEPSCLFAASRFTISSNRKDARVRLGDHRIPRGRCVFVKPDGQLVKAVFAGPLG